MVDRSLDEVDDVIVGAEPRSGARRNCSSGCLCRSMGPSEAAHWVIEFHTRRDPTRGHGVNGAGRDGPWTPHTMGDAPMNERMNERAIAGSSNGRYSHARFSPGRRGFEPQSVPASHTVLHQGVARMTRAPAGQKPKLLDQVREAIRIRHYSGQTEEAYVSWIRRFILFHNKRHPLEMGKEEITRFLSALAVREGCSLF
jgi:hypothetical protein